MKSKAVSGMMLTLLVASVLALAFDIQAVKAIEAETIYIRADGNVDPVTAPISTVDNITYTFTDNIYDQIVVERDNIVVDGAGYTVQGTGSGIGIDLTGRNNVTNKNTEIKAFESGIELYQSSNNIISGNNITNNDFGIWLMHANYNTISGSIIKANRGEGIHTFASNYNSVSENTVTKNQAGIYLWSSYNTLNGNNITNNSNGGIWLRGSNNSLNGNNIKENNRYGIYLSSSSNNAISGNDITNNYRGIWLAGSSSNNISENSITNNEYGIELSWSSDNIIYHNNFINNNQQVIIFLFTYADFWDDGYPSGGNYWSDHTGVDVKSGPYQNLTGGDGIWDTPYVIDGNNTDRYPLVNPSGGWYTLTIYTSPTGVAFTVDGVSRTTPWSGIYSEDTSVSLIMPEIHTVGDARYYWNQWSDGNTSRSRTVTLNTNIALTAYYTGPYYQLTVTSSPITGIQFTINGAPETTPYTEWVLEGSYTLIMSETHNGYVWSHWLEDGDINRTKTVTLDTNIALTGVFFHMADLNQDGTVDMRDISLAAAAFGSYPSHPRWNPVADINEDNRVDMRDLATIAKNFGKTVW